VSPTTAGLATAVASNPAHDEVRGGPLRVAVILGVAATVISAWGSWIPSLWGDEAASVLSAQRPLSTLFMMLTHVDAVHGTYYVFLHFWVDVFGASPFSVRLPPAIAVGFAVAGVVYLVAWLGTARLALVAGIICCVLPRVTYMGEETRTYAFGAAYAAWGTWVLVRLVSDTSRSRRWWVAYAVLMTFGTYAFLYFGLFVVVHGLALLSSSQGRLIMRRWLVTSAIVVGAASPLLVVGFLQRSQIAYLAGETTVTFTSMTVGLWFSTPTFAVVAWLLIIIGLAGALVRRRASPRRDGVSLVVLAVLWMIVPGLILVLISIPDNSFTGRYLSYSAPAVAILMAIGIETIARGGLRRMIGLTVITTAFAAPVYLSQRTPYAKNGSDWAEISAAIGAHAHAGDAIVFDDGARPSRRPRLALHTYPAGFTGLDDVTIMTPYQQSTTWYDRTYTVAGAEKLGRFANIHTVWVVEYVLSGKPDSYGIADLGRIGYHRLESFRTHSSLIIELGNG
jgi:mannosyltransferase